MSKCWVCPYCESVYKEWRQLQLHFLDSHYSHMEIINNRCEAPQGIKWAAGFTAALCNQ